MSSSVFTPFSFQVPSSGTSGTGQGELNIVTNPSAVTDLTGWTASVPANLSRDATGSPLDPVIPTGFNLVSTATSQTLTSDGLIVPTSLRNRKLKLEFYYEQVSGSGFQLQVAKDSGFTQRFVLTTDALGVSAIPATAGTKGKYTTYFDTDATSPIYVRFVSTGTGAIKVTQIIVGPGIQPQGAVVSEALSTTSYPTWGALTKGTSSAESAIYERSGSSIRYRYEIQLGTGGSITGSISLSAPSNFPIDTSKISSGRIIGLARLYDDNTSNRYVGDVFVDGAGNLYIEGPNGGRWSNTFPVATTINDLIAIDVVYPVSSWAGSGTVQLAQNDVEYAYNTSTSTTTDTNTTSFGYGPGGVVIQAFAPTGLSSVNKRVRFQTPIQAGSSIALEASRDGGNTWVLFENNSGIAGVYSRNDAGTTAYGYLLNIFNSTDVDVAFFSAPVPGVTWNSDSTLRWRVRKSSAGAAVGFGLADTASAGLIGTGTQTFAGVKTFQNGISFGDETLSTYNEGSTTLGALTATGTSNCSVGVAANYFIIGSYVIMTFKFTLTVSTTGAFGFNITLPTGFEAKVADAGSAGGYGRNGANTCNYAIHPTSSTTLEVYGNGNAASYTTGATLMFAKL